VPDSLLLYSRIITTIEEIYENSDDEDEYGVLKGAETEIYFTEKFRIFEKTYGIEDLHEMVKKIDIARRVSTFLMFDYLVELRL
jgi:hypothetical protein